MLQAEAILALVLCYVTHIHALMGKKLKFTCRSQVISELTPYVDLAEKVGRLAIQLVGGGSGI